MQSPGSGKLLEQKGVGKQTGPQLKSCQGSSVVWILLSPFLINREALCATTTHSRRWVPLLLHHSVAPETLTWLPLLQPSILESVLCFLASKPRLGVNFISATCTTGLRLNKGGGWQSKHVASSGSRVGFRLCLPPRFKVGYFPDIGRSSQKS